MRMLISIALVLFGLLSQAQQAYNEIFDDQGQIRSQYQLAYRLWKERHSDDQDAYLFRSRRAFRGDNALDPMPRILTQPDYQQLKLGVDQRARAIRAFLQDHYSGKKAYAQSGIVTSDQIDRIIARTGDAGYQGLVDPNTISFFYGPDIIRDANGQWRVIEDNPGFIGGLGDLILAQDLMLKTYPELAAHLQPNPSRSFYESLAAEFKARAEECGGKAVLFAIPSYFADNEDKRISATFQELGIPTVTPGGRDRLRFRDDGVFLEKKDESGNKTTEKVGFIYMNGEHAWVDPSHPASLQRFLIDQASRMLKDADVSTRIKNKITGIFNTTDPVTHLPDLDQLKAILHQEGIDQDHFLMHRNRGLINEVLSNKVGINYTPGLDFIGDKEFYVFVEDMIRFYLHEEPLIHNIETKKLSRGSTNQINEKLFEKIFANLNDYVIKRVDGRGGDSVWVGPKLKPADLPSLKKAILASPEMYIAQKYTPLSTLNDNIVDLRVITSVSPRSIIVTDTPWGRGLPKSGNGKVNLSDQGREITVLVSQAPQMIQRSCPMALEIH